MGENDDDDYIYLLVSNFNDGKSSSHSSGDQKSKMKVLVGWFHLRAVRETFPLKLPYVFTLSSLYKSVSASRFPL